MPRVSFTPNLRRHVQLETGQVSGTSVRLALDAVFQARPAGRGYVLDEQGTLRKHMIIFVDGQPIRDRAGLSDPVQEDSEIFVMQALSGG